MPEIDRIPANRRAKERIFHKAWCKIAAVSYRSGFPVRLRRSIAKHYATNRFDFRVEGSPLSVRKARESAIVSLAGDGWLVTDNRGSITLTSKTSRANIHIEAFSLDNSATRCFFDVTVRG
jgi:hypothetical protein